MPFFMSRSHSLHYREEGNGPLLLVLPGNTASSAHHTGELHYFGQRLHTVSLDFWGTGLSDRINGSWPLDWWSVGAHDAAALVEHLGQDQASVMGTSGGAVAALLMAILYPDRVRAVIADSCVERHSATSLENEVQVERARRTPEQQTFWQFAHGPDWQQVVDSDSELLLAFARNGADWFNGRLSEVACPVLLTASLSDRMLPEVGRQQIHMADQIPDCHIFLNSSGDHPLMWSRPGDFRRISDYFLNLVHTPDN